MTAQTDRSASNLANKLPHLTPDEVHSLQRMVDRLIDAYHPRQIYLFGSKVRVDSGPNSDFDLLVVVDYKVSRERKGSRLAYHALRGTGTAADVLVWTSSAFQSRVPILASLPATVVREGKLVYARWCGASHRDEGMACQGWGTTSELRIMR